MKVKNLFAVTLAGLAFTACNNDDALTPDNGPEVGKAYAAVSISINGTGTRASNGDPNAFEAENKIENIWAWINGKPIEIPLSDITWNNGVGKAKKAYEVPGKDGDQAKVWVVVNRVEPTGLPLGMSHFGTSSPQVYENLVGALTTSEKGYTMFSNAEATATLKSTETDAKDAANAAQVTVQRAAAKVLVMDSEKDYKTKDVEVTNGQGTIVAGSLKWYIGNSNRVLFCTPQLNNADPNFHFELKPWNDYNKDYVQLSDVTGAWRDLSTPEGNITGSGRAIDKLIAIADKGTTTGAATIDEVLYCNENTADDYKVSNTTYVLLAAQFTPKKLIHINVGGTKEMPTTNQGGIIAGTPGATFYVHKASGLYFTESGVTDYNAKFGTNGFDDFYTYEEAKCYYRINIKDATGNLGVLRNHYYSMAIGEISGLGSWTDPTNPVNPNIPDPEEPAEPKKALVAVDITVEPWTAVDMGTVKPL